MYVVSLPKRFLAVKNFVEFSGTSEDLARGISIAFTTTGSGLAVGELEGVGVGDVVGVGEAVGVCDALGVGAGITFPEFHVRIVFPLLFPLIHV
jgi:hypothetical protein